MSNKDNGKDFQPQDKRSDQPNKVRRRFSRKKPPYILKAVVYTKLFEHEAIVENLSLRGLMLRTKRSLGDEGEIKLALFIFEANSAVQETLFAKCQVVWVKHAGLENLYKVGLSILQMLPDDRRFYRRYIKGLPVCQQLQ